MREKIPPFHEYQPAFRVQQFFFQIRIDSAVVKAVQIKMGNPRGCWIVVDQIEAGTADFRFGAAREAGHKFPDKGGFARPQFSLEQEYRILGHLRKTGGKAGGHTFRLFQVGKAKADKGHYLYRVRSTSSLPTTPTSLSPSTTGRV